MNRNQRLSIRKVLIALDPSPFGLKAMDTAVRLAGRLGARLSGLFVEDVSLLRVAELPFAREMGPYSFTLRRFQVPELERQMRVQAARIRRAMAAAAEREGIPWEFRVARGNVYEEILSAEPHADLMIVGKKTWPQRRHTGSTLSVLVEKGRGLTLVLHPGVSIGRPVVVLYDGSDLSRKGLDAAGALVESRDGHLVVYVVAGGPESARKLQTEAFDRLKSRGEEGEVRIMTRPTLSKLGYVLQGMGPVVIPCSERLFREEGLSKVINNLHHPILLVR